MSNDWPYTKRDPNQIIEDFEKILVQKKLELEQQIKKIGELNQSLIFSEQNLKDTNAKLEYANQKIFDIEQKLIESKATLTNFTKERDDLLNTIKAKGDQISQLKSDINKLQESISNQEETINEIDSSESKILIDRIKIILYQKGFISDKEFEKLEKGEEL
jgi:chromosome segregation ATPase